MNHSPSHNPSARQLQRRVLAIDYGHARIGLAISDITRSIAQPLDTIAGDKKPDRAAKNVSLEMTRLHKEKGFCIDTIVIGLPLHLNGSESQRSGEVRAFREALLAMHPEMNIILFDERFTSLQAERSMKEMGGLTRKERAKRVDSVSCVILLQSYLDSLAPHHSQFLDG